MTTTRSEGPADPSAVPWDGTAADVTWIWPLISAQDSLHRHARRTSRWAIALTAFLAGVAFALGIVLIDAALRALGAR